MQQSRSNGQIEVTHMSMRSALGLCLVFLRVLSSLQLLTGFFAAARIGYMYHQMWPHLVIHLSYAGCSIISCQQL
jgi:hypothetical protein